MILDLAREGMSVSAIARRTWLDRKTIRKYIARGLEPPAYTPRPPKPARFKGLQLQSLEHLLGRDGRRPVPE